jgi:hypothetical protein
MAVPADRVFELTQKDKDCLNREDPQMVVVRIYDGLKALHCTPSMLSELRPPNHRLESILL